MGRCGRHAATRRRRCGHVVVVVVVVVLRRRRCFGYYTRGFRLDGLEGGHPRGVILTLWYSSSRYAINAACFCVVPEARRWKDNVCWRAAAAAAARGLL